MSRGTRLTTTVTAVAAICVVATALPAAASVHTSSSTATSTTNFTVGGTNYYQGHTGDDFGVEVISGVAIDARWASCRISGGTGAIKYNIYKGRGNVTLGTDFLASTCLKVHYRGYNSTGNFSSTQKWNWSWA